MQVQFDTLRCAKLLRRKGVQSERADYFVSTLSQIDIFNLYSQQEVDSMLSQSVKEVLAKEDLKLAEQRREFDARMQDISKYHEAQLREQRSEFRVHRSELRNELHEQRKELRSEVLASRRWIIGTVISLAAYLSALIHFNH